MTTQKYRVFLVLVDVSRSDEDLGEQWQKITANMNEAAAKGYVLTRTEISGDGSTILMVMELAEHLYQIAVQQSRRESPWKD